MSLPTLSQSVSHKRFHQCVNHKKKLSLRHPLPSFGSFSFFQASLWLSVDKVLQKLTKSYKSELRHLFQCCILIPRKCPRKTPFQHTVPLTPYMCLRNIWMVPWTMESLTEPSRPLSTSDGSVSSTNMLGPGKKLIKFSSRFCIL